MKTNIGHRIRLRRKELNFTQKQLAKLVGVSHGAISQWEKEETEPKGDNLLSLASALQCSAHYILKGEEQPQKKPDLEYAGRLKNGLVKVVGEAVLGLDGAVDMVEEHNGWLRIYSDDRDAYSLKVKGDSMWPRIQSGEFVVVEPNTPVHHGDEVFVRTKNGHNMIKIFGETRDGKYQFSSINSDHRPITMERSEIDKIQYVSAIVKAVRYIDNCEDF
ncbi:S24 family peptidase [Xenorhabdus griffiniae]|uniref:S24 family peptidase n=1 Tax=Xenorhabdus griffiniae TaxID=351672 RepID=UPI002358A63F|nr:S24 family peptidase [Xenorhabdus griffiniae]MDC9607181.1 S24 family peptidase [Xenorhabdus griffiniae]